ncbi:MAG: hypothetical protein AAGD14_01950 [Planctomycetota bacterium]
MVGRLVLLGLLLVAVPTHAQQREDDKRARLVYLRALKIEKGGSAEQALKVYAEWARTADGPIPDSVMRRIYAAAGEGDKAFKAVALLIDKGLELEDLEDKSIRPRKIAHEHSVQMAEIREGHIETIIDEIVKEKDGEWKIARSDSGNTSSGMKSDLDHTFYVFKKGPQGQWVRDPEADKAFIDLFEKKWSDNKSLPSLAALDIASIPGKNRFPDPRDVWLDFETKFLSTTDALRRTPGAYTYGGAVAQQMQFRALAAIWAGNERSFMQYTKDGKLDFDPDAAIRHMFGLVPELQPAHAYGAAVANFLELQRYMKKEKFETKYHLRTWEDAALVRALFRKNRDDRFEYLELDAEGRRLWNLEVIDEMFADPKQRRLHRLALDISADLRLVHKGKFDQVFPDGDPGTGPARDAIVFKELARTMFDVDEPTEAHIKAANKKHRHLASEFCLESVFRTAEEAFRAMQDERFRQPLDFEAYKPLMRGVKPEDWPKTRKNIQTAARITFLYSLYDLGWWKSAKLLGRMQKQFPGLSKPSLLGLWVEGRAQRMLAPIRNPELRPKLPELKIELDPDAAKAYARYLTREALPELNRQVQQRVITELGFADAEKAKAVRGLLQFQPRTWSPARFARNMVWDPGSIDALAQIVRTYITSKGDLEQTRAVIVDEIVLAVPVAGQLVAATRGGIQGAVLIAGAIQFPILGIGLLVASIGEAGYAIYDAEFAVHARNNTLDALYRGFAGPATRAYDKAPPQFTKDDAHKLKILSARLEREQTDELKTRVLALRSKKERWVAFRDGSWAGGYFSQWGAVKEQRFVRNSLLAAIPPIISYSPAGLVDFRATYDEKRFELLRKEIEKGADGVDDFLTKEKELHELEYRKGQKERADRFLRRALGQPNKARLSEREKRSGVPELLFKLRRDSVYPALLEWARRRKDEIGNEAQANPDRYVDWWLERRGAVARGELKRHGLQTDIPVQALKDRLTKDFLRSKALYEQFQKLEERRRKQVPHRVRQREQTYDAEAAGLYVADFEDPAYDELIQAMRVMAVPRQPPEVQATIYLIGDRVEARVRVKVDPHLYRGPFRTQIHQLDLRSAHQALRSGRIDGVALLARDELARAVREAEAIRNAPVVIPVVSVFAASRIDWEDALPGTMKALPTRTTMDGILLGQVVPAGGAARATEEKVEQPPPPPPPSAARAQVYFVRPDRKSMGRRVFFEKPDAKNCNYDVLFNGVSPGTLRVLVDWTDRPKKAWIHAEVTVSGGTPPHVDKGKLARASGAPKELGGTRGGTKYLLYLPRLKPRFGALNVHIRMVAFSDPKRTKELARQEFSTKFSIQDGAGPTARGGVSRHRNGRTTVSVSVQGARGGGPAVLSVAGRSKRVRKFSGTISLTLYDGSVPGSATIQFTHLGQRTSRRVTLKRGNVMPIQPFDASRNQKRRREIEHRRKQGLESQFAFPIAVKLDEMITSRLASSDPGAIDAVGDLLKELDRIVQLCARNAGNPRWDGYRYIPSRSGPGGARSHAASVAEMHRRFVVMYARLGERACDWGRIEYATDCARAAIRHANGTSGKLRADAYARLGMLYSAIAKLRNQLSGGGAGEFETAERYRAEAARLLGDTYKPLNNPYR